MQQQVTNTVTNWRNAFTSFLTPLAMGALAVRTHGEFSVTGTWDLLCI